MNPSLSRDSYVCLKTCAWFQPDITASSEDLAVICWITFTMYCLHIPLTWVAPDYACKENPVNHDNKGEVCRVLLWLSKDFTSNIARNLPFPPPKIWLDASVAGCGWKYRGLGCRHWSFAGSTGPVLLGCQHCCATLSFWGSETQERGGSSVTLCCNTSNQMAPFACIMIREHGILSH